jgi:hypothetical protein
MTGRIGLPISPVSQIRPVSPVIKVEKKTAQG